MLIFLFSGSKPACCLRIRAKYKKIIHVLETDRYFFRRGDENFLVANNLLWFIARANNLFP